MLRGIFTVLDHKKWVFTYVITAALIWLSYESKIDSSTFQALMIVLIPSVIGASSFDKSQWRKHDS